MPLHPALKSPKEANLFTVGVIFSSLCWLALTVGTLGLGLVYALLIGLFVVVAHALHLAHVRGNGVHLSERQLPDLYLRCKAAAEKLGLAEVPDVYLLQSGGVLNAFATRLLSRNFVVIYSGLVDGCEDPQELDFVVGHEMGHLAAGHLAWNAFLAPFRLLPWLGPAYSRACEYTCDRCGWAVVGNLAPAMRALAVLAGGGKLVSKMNLHAFMEQRHETGGFFMAVHELVSTHPFLCKRVAALQEVAAPGSIKEVPRNPLAYPLAPLLGIGVGSASSMAILVVLYLGILAAVAIPNFVKFQQRAKTAASSAARGPRPAPIGKTSSAFQGAGSAPAEVEP